jgi:alpha-tubulin suppressor-like RCC1 family protein
MRALYAGAIAAAVALSSVATAPVVGATIVGDAPPGLVSVASGGNSTCAVVSDQSVACWGRNWMGSLGIGTEYTSVIPQIAHLNAPVTQVTVGDGHACALVVQGTLRCWGNNEVGQVGTPEFDAPVLEPVAVPGMDDVVSVAAGEGHTCAVRADGSAWCWGAGGNGQLGAPELWYEVPPTQVPGITDAIAVTAGSYHTCLLLEDATVTCFGYWGAGPNGQHDRHYEPTPIEGFTDVIALSGGGDFTCGLIADGTARCFGTNWIGQLGDGTLIERAAAVRVKGLADVVALGAGKGHACAATGSGDLYCWGHDGDGALGHPPSGDYAQPLPEKVEGITEVSSIDGGYGFTCAIASSIGSCWGNNSEGQLGDRTVASRSQPQPLSWSPDPAAPTMTAPSLEIRSGTYLYFDGVRFSVRISVTAEDGPDGTGVDHVEARFSKDDGATWGGINWHWRHAWKKWFAAGQTLTMQVRAVDRVGNTSGWITSAPLTALLEQEDAAAITYDGGWQTGTNDLFIGGHSAYTTIDGASATITFTGRSIGLVSRMGASRGKFRVLIDGDAVGVVDLYSTRKRFQMVVFSKSWATSGEHTVRMVALGTDGRPRVDPDAFVVVR